MSDFDDKAFTSALGPLLSEGELPDLCFRSDLAEFSQAVDCLGDRMELSIPGNLTAEAEESVAITQVLDKYNALRDCPEHARYFSTIHAVASNLGERISNVFQILKSSVQPEVEDLKEQILAKSEDIMRENGTNVSLLQELELVKEFNQFDPDAVFNSFGGVQFVMDEYKALTGTEATLNISALTYGLSVIRPTITTVQMTDEAKADCLERLLKMYANEGTGAAIEDDVKKTFEMVTDNYAGAELISFLHGVTVRNDFARDLQTAIGYTKSILPILEIVRKTPFNLPEEHVNQIHANIDTLMKVFSLMQLAIVILAYMFKDAVLIDEHTVCEQNYQKYLEQGGTKDDLAKFLFVFYTSKNIPLPNTGVSAEEIQAAKETANTEFSALNTSIELNANSLRRSTIVAAAKDILMAHIEGVSEDRLPEGMSVDTFVQDKKYLVQRCLNSIDVDENNHLENCLFSFVIDLWHEGTIVQTAHNLFGQETMKQLNISNDLSDEQLTLIDARVASELAASFIVDNLCCK